MRRLCAVALGLIFLIPLASTAKPTLTKIDLFQAGTGGYASYRIPGLIATEQGTLIAYAEARKTGSDWGEIDLVMRRSTDGGRTWGEVQRLGQAPQDAERNPLAVKQKLGATGKITLNNPVAIADGKTIHFLYCVEYMRCFYCQSTDEGATWSAPREVTDCFAGFRKEYPWKVLATGPGHGLKHSKTGRLIVPVWLSTGEGGHAHRPSAVATIYSDDGGKTWRPGSIVAKHPDLANPSETVAVERTDGSVLLSIRHEDPKHFRAQSVSKDGISDWIKPELKSDLPEPVCMGSIARLDQRLYFVNPHHPEIRQRRNLSLHHSDDDGQTWALTRSIDTGFAGYSDTIIHGKQLYCFYERGDFSFAATKKPSLSLAIANAEWLRQRPIRIVALGDSITKGFRPGVEASENFTTYLEADLQAADYPVEIINVGVGGENTSQGLARLDKAVLALKPDYVLVMYGANDSYIDAKKTEPRIAPEVFRKNLTAIIDKVEAIKAKPILMTTNRYDAGHPVDGSGKHPNLQMDIFMPIVREVALGRKCPLIDHQQQWLEAEKRGEKIDKWMTDHIHPNAQGHRRMADAIRIELKPHLGQSPQ